MLLGVCGEARTNAMVLQRKSGERSIALTSCRRTALGSAVGVRCVVSRRARATNGRCVQSGRRMRGRRATDDRAEMRRSEEAGSSAASVQQRHAFLPNVKRRQDRPAAGGCGSVNTRSARRHLTESAAQVTDAAICAGGRRAAGVRHAAHERWQAARAAGAPERRPAVRAPTSRHGARPAAAASGRSPKCARRARPPSRREMCCALRADKTFRRKLDGSMLAAKSCEAKRCCER
jgi:hypothetical protein